MDFRSIAAEALTIEANEILESISRLKESDLNQIVECIYNLDSKLVILGVGKSGIIGKKIAATLSSTGTPSIFAHPTEAMHGDLGMINKHDVVLAISYSGESEELTNLMPHLKNLCHKIITMTRNKTSSISKYGDYFIDISVKREACPLNTAPTSSTTLTLALGDALAICLMKRRNFSKNNFATFHPGGDLGKKLFVKIKDLMQTKNIPMISKNTSMQDAIIEMTNGKLGCTIIVDNKKPIGILSDGDLRRAIMNKNFNMNNSAIMYATLGPKTCDDENALAYDILKIIENSKIQLLIITDKYNNLRGVIHLHKLIEAGIKE